MQDSKRTFNAVLAETHDGTIKSDGINGVETRRLKLKVGMWEDLEKRFVDAD